MKTEALIRRREMRVVVWWNGDKDLAQECKISSAYKAAPGFTWIVTGPGMVGAQVPESWIYSCRKYETR